MSKLLVIVALVLIAYKMIAGRWPWEKRLSARAQAIANARQLLGVGIGAQRADIVAAHRRMIAMVHPDKGGTNAQVHEVDAARDVLLEELPRTTRLD